MNPRLELTQPYPFEKLAALLDSAVMVPNTTQGGAYTISRIAPRTVPYVQWGNDDDRLFGLVISDEFLTPAERGELPQPGKSFLSAAASAGKHFSGDNDERPAFFLQGFQPFPHGLRPASARREAFICQEIGEILQQHARARADTAVRKVRIAFHSFKALSCAAFIISGE